MAGLQRLFGMTRDIGFAASAHIVAVLVGVAAVAAIAVVATAAGVTGAAIAA